MKKFAVLATIAAATLLVGGVADAYPPDYPPGAPTVAVDDSTPAPAGSVTATVSNCAPGEAVTFTLEGDSSVVACGADGTAAATLDVPAAPGSYNGTAALAISDVTLTFSIAVALPANTIPATGSDGTRTTTTVALVMVAGGGALILGARHRRREQG